jgi:hypothetical protein
VNDTKTGCELKANEWRDQTGLWVFERPTFTTIDVRLFRDGTKGDAVAWDVANLYIEPVARAAALAYHRLAYLGTPAKPGPILADECYPPGELPRKMKPNEVRMPDGSAGEMRVVGSPDDRTIVVSRDPASYYLDTPGFSRGEGSPFANESQRARAQAFLEAKSTGDSQAADGTGQAAEGDAPEGANDPLADLSLERRLEMVTSGRDFYRKKYEQACVGLRAMNVGIGRLKKQVANLTRKLAPNEWRSRKGKIVQFFDPTPDGLSFRWTHWPKEAPNATRQFSEIQNSAWYQAARAWHAQVTGKPRAVDCECATVYRGGIECSMCGREYQAKEFNACASPTPKDELPKDVFLNACGEMAPMRVVGRYLEHWVGDAWAKDDRESLVGLAKAHPGPNGYERALRYYDEQVGKAAKADEQSSSVGISDEGGVVGACPYCKGRAVPGAFGLFRCTVCRASGPWSFAPDQPLPPPAAPDPPFAGMNVPLPTGLTGDDEPTHIAVFGPITISWYRDGLVTLNTFVKQGELAQLLTDLTRALVRVVPHRLWLGAVIDGVSDATAEEWIQLRDARDQYQSERNAALARAEKAEKLAEERRHAHNQIFDELRKAEKERFVEMTNHAALMERERNEAQARVRELEAELEAANTEASKWNTTSLCENQRRQQAEKELASVTAQRDRAWNANEILQEQLEGFAQEARALADGFDATLEGNAKEALRSRPTDKPDEKAVAYNG